MKRHPRQALSPVFVKNVTTPGSYADGNGLYLEVAPGGSKSWVVRTTINRKRCEIGCGGLSYTSLAEARLKAIEIRKSARNGGDPLADKRNARNQALRESSMPTFEAAARIVHSEHAKAFTNTKHSGQWISTLKDYAFPIIGARRIDTIESADILKILTPIWLEKATTASRILQRMRLVFDWAIASGHRAANPCQAITQVLPKQKSDDNHHPALPYAEVPEFVRALRDDPYISGRLAFEFLILTAARTGEVIRATWTEIDLKKKVWTRPAAHMKSRKEHKVPLCDRAIEILMEAKRITDGGPFIFPGTGHHRPLGRTAFPDILMRLQKTDITPHGFRSSFTDWAQEKTHHKPHTIDQALAHAVGDKVQAAYLRTQVLEERRDLMSSWARFCSATPAVKVVKMRG